MPDEYKDIDIAKWVLDQCTTQDQLQRVGAELLEFQRRDMMPLLKWMKYFVDTCRTNKILWGVGRGSSVASYVLYLIGVHRIDSMKYNLDWQEFLR
jgi:DNA polymerase III alpha subunit